MSDDALTITGVRKHFGGNQLYMKDSIIKDSSYLGPFEHPQKLKIDETQKMHFTELDQGPFYLNQQQRDRRQFDEVIGTKNETLTILALIDALKQKGIKDP